MSPDGLNKFEELQVETIAERVVEKINKHFVTKLEHTDIVYKQNLKINAIYGILTVGGLSGLVGVIYKIIVS